MDFPFSRLSTELVLEIIGFAASPEGNLVTSMYGRNGTYKNALALAGVCYDFRRATMPHLLHTVILSTHRDVHLFIRALLRQCRFRRNFPHLVLDYKHYIHRLWCTESTYEISDQQDLETTLGYDLFYDLICNVQSLGLGMQAFHLVLNGLSNEPLTYYSPTLSSRSSPVRCCTSIALAGPSVRWDPLTNTMQGIRFLSRLNRLTLWITDLASSLPTHTRIPAWVGMIPFRLLENLEQLEILLVPELSEEELNQIGYYGEYYSPHPLEVLVLTRPSWRLSSSGRVAGRARGSHQTETQMCADRRAGTTKSNAEVMGEWLRSTDPLACGIVCPLEGIPRTAVTSISMTSGFESHFLEERSHYIPRPIQNNIRSKGLVASAN